MKHTRNRDCKAILVTTFLWATLAFVSCKKEGYVPYPNPSSTISRVQFTTDQLEIAEGQQEMVVEVLITPAAKTSGTITLNVTNNQVVYGDDYHTNPVVTDGKIIIPVQAGAEKVSFTLLPVNNELLNPARSITFTMAQPENSTLKPQGKISNTTKLLDDEMQVNIGFEQDRSSVYEDNGAGYQVKLPLTGAAAEDGFVEITYTPFHARYEEDFQLVPAPVDGKLRIPIARHSSSASFLVIPKDDHTVSDNRSILFTIVGASPLINPSGQTNFTLFIRDKENDNRLTVQSIRNSYQGELLYFQLPVFVEGVVVSATDNIGPNMLFLQDETGGIAFLFNSRHNVQPGERIVIKLEGGVLEELNQALTITNIPVEQLEKKGREIHIIPEMNLRELYERPGAREGQLVTLTGVQFPAANGSTTLEGVHFIQGNNREARVLVNSFASFRNQIIPGGIVSVTGIPVWNDAGYYTIIPQRAGDIK